MKERFFYLLLLTGFFVLLEISFFIQCNQAYLFDYTFVTHHLSIPWRILPGIGFFIFVELGIHFLYSVLVWVVANQHIALLNCSKQWAISWSVSLWMMGILTVLSANQLFFPNSKFAELTLLFMNDHVAYLLYVIGSGLIVTSVLLALAFILVHYVKWSVACVMASCALYGWSGHVPFVEATPSLIHRQSLPNLIIVGIDSLRPDFLGFFGSSVATPFLDHFLEQSVVFEEAMTPLARTFPAWSSILTGQYPKESGIRTNLAQYHAEDVATALPFLLKQVGYETVYATDEARFSNLGVQYGFDHLLTPAIGLNDFLLGTFNDFPLSNVLINTTWGAYLFPYSYANRPAYFVYEPNRFVEKMTPFLRQTHSKPLFLAIHFCLPHYPYLWAGLSSSQYSVLERYAMSVMRVDQQLKTFFSLLQTAHLLDNAIVVVLSDHGEAFALPGDRVTEKEFFISHTAHAPLPKFYSPGLDHEGVNQSVGHGTDVLSLAQYHTLLAFRIYGDSVPKPRVISGMVSLLSIKPTLLSLIHFVNHSREPQQISLAEALFSTRGLLPHTHIFLESDFTPEAIRTVYPEMRSVVLEGIQLFQIDPITTQLMVKPNMYQKIIESKQYADIYGHWMLAMYPQLAHRKIFILVNLLTGEWTDNLQSTFSKASPALLMQRRMNQFFFDNVSTKPSQI